MSGNQLNTFCDEQKMLEYIYDDVDDSEIFATEPLNNSLTESDHKSETDSPTQPIITQSFEIIEENKALKETVEKLQNEQEILKLRISELYKTAKAELERKDRRLKDLEREKDNLLFRRGNNVFKKTEQFNDDARIPVLQKVEKDFTNADYQNFNARYRIPKKINVPLTENNETNTKHDEHSDVKKYQHDEKYWSAYPHVRDKPTKHSIDRRMMKQDVDGRGSNHTKEMDLRQRNIGDCSKFDSRKQINRESKTTSSPSTKQGSIFNENNKEISFQRKIEKEQSLNQSSRSKLLNKDIEPTDNAFSQEKEHKQPLKERSRSLPKESNPLSNDVVKKSVPVRRKSLSRCEAESLKHEIRKPRSPSREREPEKFSRSRSKVRDLRSKLNKNNPVCRQQEYQDLSKQRSRSRSKEKDVTQNHYSRSKSSSRYKCSSPENQLRRPKSPPEEKHIQWSRQRSRSRSRKRGTYSQLQEKEDVYANDRRHQPNSRDRAMCKYETDESKKRNTETNKDHYKNKSQERESEDNKMNCSKFSNREDNCNMRYDRSLSKEKNLERTRKDSERSKDNRDKDRESRGRYLRRSRSVSRDRYDGRRPGLRRSRSVSQERYLKNPPERGRYGQRRRGNNFRNAQRFRRNRSRSSSLELDGREGFGPEGDLASKRDRQGNIIDHQFRRDRSRSKSMERLSKFKGLQTRGRTPKPGDIAKLRERLLRFSIDRETHKEETNQDQKKILTNNETDQSDLDDLKLHLSGDSDIESLRSSKGKRIGYSKCEDDLQFEPFNDLSPRTIDRMTDEEILRVIEDKRKFLGSETSHGINEHYKEFDKAESGSEQEEDHHVQFSQSEEELIDDDDYDQLEQPVTKNKDFWYGDDVEELDYEVEDEFPKIIERRKKEFKNEPTNFEDNKSKRIHDDPRFVETPETKINENELLNQKNAQSREKQGIDEPSHVNEPSSTTQFMTVYSARLHNIRNKNQKVQKSEGLQKITKPELTNVQKGLQENTEISRCKSSDAENENLLSSRTLEKRKEDKAILEDKNMHKLNEETNNSKQEFKAMKSKDFSADLCKDINKIKNVCTSTHDQVVHMMGELKAVEYGSKEYSSELEDVNEKNDDKHNLRSSRNVEKDVVSIVSKKREKISFSAYKSRNKSTDRESKETNVQDSVNCTPIVSATSHIKSNIHIKNERNSSIEKTSAEDIAKLPDTSDDVQKCGKSENVTNVPTKNINKQERLGKPKKKNEHIGSTSDRMSKIEGDIQGSTKNENITNTAPENIENLQLCVLINKEGERSAINKFGNAEKKIEERKNENIHDDQPKQDNINVPLKSDQVNQEDVITDDESNDTVKVSAMKSAQENDSYKDSSSFLHDFSLSDDEDIPVRENVLAGKEEVINKINILSDIRIHCTRPNASCTHPPPTTNVLQTSNNTEDVNMKRKEYKNSKSRRSLFNSASIEETQNAVNNIPVIEDKFLHNSSHILPHTNNTIITPVAETDSKRTYSLDGSECIEEIQEAITNMIGYTATYNSTKSALNTSENFDTQELQKCLEEDIGKSKTENSNSRNLNAKKSTSPFEIETEKPAKEINKIEDSNNEQANKKKKGKRKEKQTQNKERKTTSDSEEKPIESNAADKMVELFGYLTPSPLKPSETNLEIFVNKDNAKRKILTEVDYINESFHVRDKNEEIKKKDSTSKDNQTKRKRSKSTDEKKIHEKVQQQEIRCQSQDEEKSKHNLNQEIKNFCSNPTYIPLPQDKQNIIFDSPNHYIQKKNKEIKTKVNIDTLNTQSKEENLKQEDMTSIQNIKKDQPAYAKEDIVPLRKASITDKDNSKNRLSDNNEDTVVKDESEKAVLPSKRKRTKKTNPNDESSEKQEKIKIIKEKSPKERKKGSKKSKENVNTKSKQVKKNLPKNSPGDEKKSKSSCFKIKLNNTRKRQKNNSGIKEKVINKRKKLNSFLFGSEEESSDSFDEGNYPTTTTKKETDDIEIENENVKGDEYNKEPAVTHTDSQLEQIKTELEIESKRLELNKIERISKPRVTRHKKLIETKNQKTEKCNIIKQDKATEQQTCKTEEKKESFQGNAESNESRRLSESNNDYVKAGKKDTHNEVKSALNSPCSNTSNEFKQEPVKTIKRITPKRIDDSYLRKREQEFKALKVKKELYVENRSPEIISNKRKQSSNSSEEGPSEKIKKITYVESTKTVEEDVMDNGAQTRIKVQETHLNIEVAPSSSPLARFEQTYVAWSQNNASSGAFPSEHPFVDAASAQSQPTEEAKNFKNVQLHVADNTFSEINLDTKDIVSLGGIDKEVYLHIPDLSISDKSILYLGYDNKTKDDKDSGENVVQSGKNEKDKEQLSFTNFLNKNQNTSTPIKNRIVMNVKNYAKVSLAEETNSKEAADNIQRSDNPYTCSVIKSDNKSSDNIPENTLSTANTRSAINRNVSGDKTSSDMTSSISNNGSQVSRNYVKFSGLLKRDRRRPVAVRVVD